MYVIFRSLPAGQPALMSFENVRTMFHEFGHALHGFFASQQYPDLSGARVARDFVEFPSQFNEHWALDPIVFKHYALHYKTGDLMPESLVIKIKNASAFNQVYKLTEALEASVVDMRWHTLSAKDPLQNSDTLRRMFYPKPIWTCEKFRHVIVQVISCTSGEMVMPRATMLTNGRRCLKKMRFPRLKKTVD